MVFAKCFPHDQIFITWLAVRNYNTICHISIASLWPISLSNNAPTLKDSARLRSIQCKGAGAWLDAIPSSSEFAIESCDYRLASLMRLGYTMPFSSWSNSCDCGKSLESDTDGYRFLTCKTGGGSVYTHNSIVRIWSACLGSLNLHHVNEAQHRYCNSDNRPDITVLDYQSGKSTDLDVSMAHPWSMDILSKASLFDGAAALRREEIKAKKYLGEILPQGSSPSAVPLVFEHFG